MVALVISVTHCGVVQPFAGAKRLECVELAPAFWAAAFSNSASELDALHTLRDTALPVISYVSISGVTHTKEAALNR